MRKLIDFAADYKITLTNEMALQFEKYMHILLEYNQKVNLTAITDPEEIIIKHFLDSLLPLCALQIPQNATVVDVGTGAGFPGVPIKIVRPDIRLTMIDSLKKRTVFLEMLSEELGQQNNVVHGRAEELVRGEDFRESYDFAFARAVASLPVLCEYCLPLVRVNGCFIAMKGPGAEVESAQAERAIKTLGGALRDIKWMTLPKENTRALVLINKISQTPPKYPRLHSKITKTPL